MYGSRSPALAMVLPRRPTHAARRARLIRSEHASQPQAGGALLPAFRRREGKLTMRPFRSLKCFFRALVAAISTIAGRAWAQSKAPTPPPLALDRFDTAPAGDRMFGVQSPFAAGRFTPHLMLLLDYAHNPLVLRQEKDETTVGSVVSSQLFLHLNGSLS